MRRFLVALGVLLLMVASAHAQTPPLSFPYGTSSSFGSGFPGIGTAAGFRNPAGNMDWGLVDASHYLQVNCVVGCFGGTYNSTLPTLTPGQSVTLQVDVNGRLIVTTNGQPVPAGTNTIGGVTQSGPPWTVSLVGMAQGGGVNPFHLLSAATNNSTLVKGSPGTAYSLTIIQTTTTLGDFRFYDSAVAPTCSSATGVVQNFAAQSNGVGPGLSIDFGPSGLNFANGIGFCYTGVVADNDNTPAATGSQINIGYK